MSRRDRVQIPLKLGESVRSASNELVVNAYAEPVEGGKGAVILRSHPGLGLNLTAVGSYRGSISLNDFPIAVYGEFLYRITSDGNTALLGALPGTGYVILAAGLDETVITNEDGNSYRYASGAVTQITDGDYQLATSVTNINGTTVWSVDDTADFIWSSPADASTISALDIASAEYKSDKLVRVFEHKTDLLLFGTYSVEGWFDTAGQGTSAFARRGDLLLDIGLAGKYAVTSVADTVFFLAHDGTVRMIEGGVAVRISTAAVERRIMGDPVRDQPGWTDLSLTRIFAYVWRGHLFITVRHPDGCVQYDLTTKFWGIRQSYGSDTWRIVDAILAYSRCFLFDEGGKVYELDETTRYENGTLVEWIAITPPIYDSGNLFILDRVDFAMDTGRSTDPSLDPVMIIDGSDDDYTFNRYEEVSLGQTGEYDGMVSITQLGQCRQKTLKLTVTDDVPVALEGMWKTTRPCRG